MNKAKFLGCVITFEELKKIINTFEKNLNINIVDFYEQELYKIAEERYGGINVGHAFSVFDPQFEDWTFYISLSTDYYDSDLDPMTWLDIQEIQNSYPIKHAHFKQFLQDTGISYREPKFIALPHVTD